MKFPLKVYGLFQALCLTLYVIVFTFCVQNFHVWAMTANITPSPILAMILFLLAFVISGLICGSIIFVYPIVVFTSGKKIEALKIVLWSAAWLVVLFVVFLATAFLISLI